MSEELGANEVTLVMDAVSVNEGLARVCAAAFVMPVNPDVSELQELKMAVSEAVTNAVLHGYSQGAGAPRRDGGACKVTMHMRLSGREVTISVRDEGVGISDLGRAREPLYSTLAHEERSGMGFTVMESFMDAVDVVSAPGSGTEIVMRKRFADGQNSPTN